MIRQIPGMATCANANEWVPHLKENRNRIGIKFQCQHATAQFWVSSNEDTPLLACQRIDASMLIVEDILPGQEALYVQTDTPGATLTVIEKFQTTY
ncbi:MAG TPA: hypothetical protein VK149_12570 [Sideroxyarcus sp.]|nr:hypothetical protein [Sideroxyarcus sp.]